MNAMTYINFTDHSIERCVQRNPQFKDITYQNHAKEEAKIFLETLLREWISAYWQAELNLKRTIDTRGVITLTNWEHKLVYTKVWIWELLIITYWYKWEIEKLEYNILKMLPKSKWKTNRYRKY